MSAKQVWMIVGGVVAVLLMVFVVVLIIRGNAYDTRGINTEYVENLLASGTRVGKEEIFMGGRFKIYKERKNYLAVAIFDTDESEWSGKRLLIHYGYLNISAEEYYKKYGNVSGLIYYTDEKLYRDEIDGEYSIMREPTYTQKVVVIYACEKWIVAWRLNEEQYRVFVENHGLDLECDGEGDTLSVTFLG